MVQTASIMQWFSALIPAYPEIQAKAHAELDRVVGRNRLPTIDDEKNLPFIHAIIKVIPAHTITKFNLHNLTMVFLLTGSRALPQSFLARNAPC